MDSSINISDNNEKSKETIKKKSPRACAPCRKRKVKCNSLLPCDRCLKNNVNCVYDKPQQKKEIPKPITDSHEPRLKHLQQFLKQLSKVLDMSDPKPPLYSNPNQIGNQHNPSIYTTGQGSYVPDKLLRIDRVPSIYHQPLQQQDNMLIAKQEVNQSEVTIINTPIHEKLLQLYFDFVDPVIPIIHKQSFYYELKDNHYHNDRPFISNLLLNAIYCVSSRWDLNVPSNGNEPRGWYFYQTAVNLLDQENEPKLSTVQAIFLLLKYNEHVRRPGFIWRTRYYFQMIVRMCKDLGLSRDLPTPIVKSSMPIEIEKRKRTFWAIFSYDVMMSIEYGLLPNFSHIECCIEYPTLLTDEVEESDKIIHFILLSKIMKHQFDIIQFLHCKYEKKFELNWNEEIKFKKLSSELEATIQFITSTTQFPQKDTICYTISFLYLAYSFTIILLYRPFMSDDIKYQTKCKEAATNIKNIVDLLSCIAIENMYCSIRGIQQIIHYLSSANTIFKQLNLNKDYEITMDLTKRLASISPATEVIGNIKYTLPQQQTQLKRKSFHQQQPQFNYIPHNIDLPNIPNHESLLSLLYNEDDHTTTSTTTI